MSELPRFPFGAPIRPCGAAIPDQQYPVVVIGAYPSALHVRWTPPVGFGRAVAALPVGNEPTPFWDGRRDEVESLFGKWRAAYFDDRWGRVSAARLNGPSGSELEPRWLRPFGYERADAFITDCLTTARSSPGVMQRLADRYQPIVAALDAPPTGLAPHPSENDIVTEALRDQVDRLTGQIDSAQPDLIITLGNAAARVLAGIGSWQGRAPLSRAKYGADRHICLRDRTYCWRALIHPAAPSVWQQCHDSWLAETTTWREHEPQPGDTVIEVDNSTDPPTVTLGPVDG